ncbi:Dynein heavy chain 1, axonemal [Stylophora pistillata]|uniref:Dynein heavy chain 1, axonemal n=1 Tax=Stylophora pistillata TaxID=50429 RepID=A0A2B4SDS4_STYPI|nr:Dynein heavy chain 1, axonemal [Stylophora pistillata]
MENDSDEPNPIVPHNSVVDFRFRSSVGNSGFSRIERRDDSTDRQNQPVKRTINDGRAAIDSLKSRLYDRPENSEVFRAMYRPVPPSSVQTSTQGSPHPPPKGGPRSTMGNYRTTMFRRDFNRLQVQRNQGFPKETVSVKQGGVELEQGNLPKRETKLDPQHLKVANGAAFSSLEEDNTASNDAENLHLDQRSEFSNSERLVDQVSSAGSFVKSVDETDSVTSSKTASNRPLSHKLRASSGKLHPPPPRGLKPDFKGNKPKSLSQGILSDEELINCDVSDVIMKLRQRLNMSTDLDAIANGEDPDEDDNNINRLYIREDDGKFVYCLPKNRAVRAAQYNPYDLVCVTSQEAQSNPQYFTVTASAVTQVRKGFDSELTPLKRWLYERKIFNIIFGFPTFTKFRLRKGYTSWRNNVRFQRNCSSRSEVVSSLFSATEASQQAILLVRALCEKASSSITGLGEGEEGICLLHVDPQKTFTLKEFVDAQTKQAQEAKEKLTALRVKVLEIVKEACEKITEEEGLTEWVHPERKKEQKKKKKPADTEGKKKKGKVRYGPSFTQMSQWRGVLHRLTCFIRMIDFLVMELLRRLVLTASRTLLAQVKAASMLGSIVHLSLMEPTLEREEKKNIVKFGTDDEEEKKAVPLLLVELVLNVPPAEEGGVDNKTVSFEVQSAQRPQTGGKSTPYTGDGTSFDDDTMTIISGKDPSVMSTSSQTSLTSRSFVSLKPTEQDFETALQDIIYGFEQTAASFKSLVHDPQLSVYVNPPAGDVVYALSRDVDEEERVRKIPWPDSELLFGQDPDYQNDVGLMFHQINDEVDNVLNFSKKYKKFCVMVDKSRRVDVDGSLKEREWNTEEFYVVLNQHTEEVLEMSKMVLHKRLGLFQVDITGFQSDCLPYLEKVLEAVARHLPVMAAKRNDVLLNVIKHASRKLDKMPETVEAFVEHLIFLSRMGNEISALEEEYNIVTRMYSIARNFDMTISAEELALYQTLMPSFQHLKSTILYCEAKKDQNIQRHSRALNELISTVRRELVIIKNKVCSPALLDADNIPQVATEKLKLLKEDLANLSTKARNYVAYQERFGSSMSSSLQKKALTEGAILTMTGHSSPQATSLQSEVTEVEKDLTLRCLLWESLQEWQGLVDQWEATPFETLNVDEVQRDVTRFIQTVFLLEKGLPPTKVVPRIKQKVVSFKQGMPVITSLRNPALRTRHWEAIQNVIGTRIVRDKYFTLGHLLQLKVFQHKEKISDISSYASNEATLEQMLQKVMDYWNHTDFQLSAHTSRDIAIITGADDIITAVEESQVTLSNIRGSRFVTPIKALVEDWDRKLKLFARTLDEWLLCQRNWLYLETIFSAADIQRQLPNEARLFAQVDKSWRDIMRRTIDKPNAFKASTAAGVLEVLQTSNSHLEKIHRCLEDYLETKRLVFARFYFLSNEDLLDILANSKNPNAVQPHLRKCFGNIYQLSIVRQAHSPAQIQNMTSEEGESVLLPKTLRARGTVESWLFGVELAMYETVKMHLRKCLVDYGTREYSEWVLAHPGQAILTVSQIVFNRDVLTCFRTTKPKEALQNKREKLVSVLHSLSQMVTSSLVPHQHQTLEALLTIDVHARDVLDSMIANQVYQMEDFQWTRQLRYEWNDERQACMVRHSNAVFEYGYEYLGCSPRLVITPLTDRCYLTLTGALNLHLNGAPAGPAGTGKTETVKDLGKAMGKQCLVFNCSEGLDYKMMGKFFSGLAQSGSWFCFDEFNRIDVEVLSVIAQQLHTIKTAKDNNVTRFLFEGRDIKLNANCGMFITMNPGYAGRVELPDNLKSLFRPVAMMVPDYALIAEIILFSEGFTAAALLSGKVVNLYQLASKQLSQQDHYDFGLRAIKSVLLMAGQRRRAASLNMASETLEEEDSHLIINAVKDANIPKVVAEDAELFKSILADLFPGLDPPVPDNKLLKKAAKAALGELSIQYWPSQIDKVIQLNSTFQVRHGVMLVGPAGGGKTTTRQILKRALVVLPSIQAREQQETKGTGEYPEETESSKSALFQMVLCLANGERIGMGHGMRILFEVDNLAMASPATVSRCGMVYMLPGEVFIHLLQLFEHSVDTGLRFLSNYKNVQHITAPDLSIVSTLCSIITGFLEIMNSQGGLIAGEVPNTAEDGAELSETTSAKTVTFADNSEHEINPIRKVSFIQRNPSQLLSFLGKVYVFAYTWAFGGNLRYETVVEDEEYEDAFAKDSPRIWELFDTMTRDLFDIDSPIGVRLPPGNESMANYYIDMESGQFSLWSNLVPSTRALIAKAVSSQFAISDTLNTLDDPPPMKNQLDIDRSLVPTVDTVRYAFLLSLLALNGRPVLLTGETGVGKSALIQDTLVRLSQPGGSGTSTGTILGAVFRTGGMTLVDSIMDITDAEGVKGERRSSEVVFNSMLFSAYTSSSKAQKFIESKLVKRGRDVVGPRPGKKVLLFVDDLNIPQPDAYQSQPPLELLRQFLDSRGFYDSKKLQWKEVHDVTLLAACAPPGGGRSAINGRLLRHFSVLYLPHPNSTWLHHIYVTQLGRFLEKADFALDVRDACQDLVTTAMGLYFELSANLLPTPTKSHYTFNLRDLNKVIEGLLQANPFVITSRDHCAQLLGHEASRVLHDRLTNDADRRYFFKVLSEQLHNGFKTRWTAEELEKTPLIFGDFLEGSEAYSSRLYRSVRQYDRLPQILEEYYDKANLSGGSVEHRFVFFNMAVQHVTRAARVFRQPGKHMQMVGVGGTGKATVAKLAAYIEDCAFFRPYVSRVYNLSEFRDDVKKACTVAGVKGKNTVLFLSDNLVKDEFLEDVTSILAGADIASFYDHEDVELISLDLKKEAILQGVSDTKDAIFQFFLERVKQKLHMVLSTTPAGSSFRRRCRLYPPLINCCTIDWFDKWPLDALQSVAVSFLELLDLGKDPESNSALLGSVSKVFVEVYNSVEQETQKFHEEVRRRYYTTPTSYMEFVRLYLCKLNDKRAELSFNRDRLCTGLQKLSETNELVGTMQTELLQLGPKLEQKAKDTEKLLEQLASDQEAVDQVHSVVQKEEEIMNEEALRVQAIAEEAQRDLEGALPQLQAAVEALDSLDKSDISEIRVYTKPPTMVMTVLSAVCVLLQQKPDWNSAKLLLGDQGFLKKLVGYDKNSIPDKVFTRLKRYTQHPEFNPEAVGKISVACKSMCQWVLALENYAEVYKIVQPKQRRCEEAQAALAIAKENLQQKQLSLLKIQEQLQLLKQQYDGSVAQLEELKQKKELTIVRLQRASVLTAALAEEQVRWSNSVNSQEEDAKGLIGDTLVSSAAVAYLGAFTSSYRHRLLSHWLQLCKAEKIPVSQHFELTEFLSEPIEVQNWLNKGLPHDKHSIENAVLIKHCRRWPLLIDPQEQASKWITQTEKDNGLKIVKASDPGYLRTLESAIPLGQPVLVEDLGENLDPSLNPILGKNTITRGNQEVMVIGDTEIEYNSNFRLYMTTPLANPHFLPEVCIKVTVINFTVTLDGLQDQLLSRVVQKERPKLEESRKELLHGLVTDRYKLRELEDRSLSLLHQSHGNILDDEDLISTLDDSKKVANVIHTRVVQSEETEEKINLSREKYLPVATRGAVLYFVLTDLAYVDVMYQFSLPWFTDLFDGCLESAQEPAQTTRGESPIRPGSAGTLRPIRKDKLAVSTASRPGFKRRQTANRPKDATELPEYLEALVEVLTESVYRVVSYALFACHKLTFSFMLCAGIMRRGRSTSRDKAIDEEEWNWFFRGSAVAAITDRLESEEELNRSWMGSQTTAAGSLGQYMSKMNKSPAKWITESTWKECLQLSASILAFSGLCSNIAVNGAFWSKFSASENPFKFIENEGELENDKTTSTEDHHPPQLGWNVSSLSRFQRLIIVKVLRPECLVDSVRLFVEQQMGPKFVTSFGFDLQEVFEESSCRKPLIFILSPGSDPTSQLMRFARETRGTSLHLDIISLGKGQGPRAEEAITKAYQQKGKWVFLQNCHHAASFMPRLQMIVGRISHPGTRVDPNFRMWLSSKPDPSFPVSILQAGLKMTVEPPPGIKANLLRSLGGVGGVVTESMWEDSGPGPSWKRLVFGLCFFNAIVHERKKFGALGWNIPYEFTASDLEVSILMLHMLLTEHHEVPWKAIRYLTGEIVYAGRVTDNWDQRCLQSILGNFYTPLALQESYGYTLDYVYRPPPPEISLSVCCEYIEGLPAADAPELFGMDQNAETAYLAGQGRAFIADLLAAQPRLTASIGSNKTNDDTVMDLVNDTLKYLPPRVDFNSNGVTADQGNLRRGSVSPDRLRQMAEKKLSQDPLADHANQSAYVTVLRQELNRFDRLLGIIYTSLSSLRLAVKGEVLMSEQLEEAYDALLSNRVPKAWEQAAYESCKPLGAWVDNLAKRVDFFSSWLDLVRNDKRSKSWVSRETGVMPTPTSSQSSMSTPLPRDHPIAFWLPAFFFPQGFLTAILQTHARQRNLPVDSLSFRYQVLNEKWTNDERVHSESDVDCKRVAFQGTPPDEGSLVFGLYLDGASWDFKRGCLQESLPGQRFYPLPQLLVSPIQQNLSTTPDGKDKEDAEEDLHTYECPLYRTSLRASSLTSTDHPTNFVTSVNLQSVQPADYWITRGVALLCQLDD